MTGEAVEEVVLAAVSFIRDHDDVAAVREQRVLIALGVGEELLDRGEDDASGLDVELVAQVGAGLRLRGRLAEEVLAS